MIKLRLQARGSASATKKARTLLAARYLAGLRTHLVRKGRGRVGPAKSLGRAILADGFATLDLANMHDQAIVALASSFDFAQHGNDALKRAGFFFSNALIPLEKHQQAIREHNAHLKEHNQTLRKHAAAMARGSRRLEREIAHRKDSELEVIKGQQHCQNLFSESQIMENKLRHLTRKIITVQEEERKMISRELHDVVMQTLVGINVELSALGHGNTLGMRSLNSKITRTQRLVENSVKTVHRFARDLRPAVLDDLGLIPALHAFCKSLTTRRKLKIQMTAFGGVELLESEKRTVVFRLAQEALTNIERHARAKRVIFTIAKIPGAIRVEISDDGKSFPVQKILQDKTNKRLGLIGMRERVKMVGGELTIESTPGIGTTVRAEIPFTPEKIKK